MRMWWILAPLFLWAIGYANLWWSDRRFSRQKAKVLQEAWAFCQYLPPYTAFSKEGSFEVVCPDGTHHDHLHAVDQIAHIDLPNPLKDQIVALMNRAFPGARPFKVLLVHFPKTSFWYHPQSPFYILLGGELYALADGEHPPL